MKQYAFESLLVFVLILALLWRRNTRRYYESRCNDLASILRRKGRHAEAAVVALLVVDGTKYSLEAEELREVGK